MLERTAWPFWTVSYTLKDFHFVEYKKVTHTDQYLLFYSHHPLVHKLGVIRNLQH